MPVSGRPSIPGTGRKNSSWCSCEVPPLIAPPTRLALRCSSSRGPRTRRVITREPKPGARSSMRCCIRSANRSQSSRPHDPRIPPSPASRTAAPGWGTWVYAHIDSVPTGERVGSVVVIWPASRNGEAGIARASTWPSASVICSTESAM